MRALRFLVQRLLRGINFEIHNYVTAIGPDARLLDLAVAACSTATFAPFVVQVGANDGQIADPVRHLILKYHLPGLLIEPMPDVFAQLLASYAGQSQLSFENAALWSNDGQCPFYRFRPGTYANPLIKGMAGMSREVLARSATRHLPGMARQIEAIQVRTLSPGSLFAKHGVSRVDLLVVDTEGFDDQIIQLILDFGMTPSIIHYEHLHLAPDRQDACAGYLKDRGYSFARTRADTLALLGDGPCSGSTVGSRAKTLA